MKLCKFKLYYYINLLSCSRLVERLQNMRNNAAGDGVNNCILCGETFSFFTRHRTHLAQQSHDTLSRSTQLTQFAIHESFY